MSQKEATKSKKKHNKFTYNDVRHAIDKNDSNTDFTTLLNNIEDQILIGYGNTIHTLLYRSIIKSNIRAFIYLIKEYKKRFMNNDKYPLSFVLNRGTKSLQNNEITPLAKILLLLRKDTLNHKQRLQYRHMASLLIANGVDVNHKSVMTPHKNKRKSATDYQIIEPIEIAFSLCDPEIFLAIMFRNKRTHKYDNPLIEYIQSKIYKLWYNEYDAEGLNVINLHCNDCCLDIFAEALRYLYMLKPKNGISKKQGSIFDYHLIKYHKMINNIDITQVEAIKTYYDSPKTVKNWSLGIHLTYNPYDQQRNGLLRFISVLPTIYNLKQLNVTWLHNSHNSQNRDEDDICSKLLHSLSKQCRKYGTITHIELNGLKISPKSMDWLSDAIVNWNWCDSLFEIITIGYLRSNMSKFSTDIAHIIYKYYFDEKSEEMLQIECEKNKLRELEQLSLVNVGLNNECIEKLCTAMKTSHVLRIKKIILNENIFNIIGLITICRFIEEIDCIYVNHLEIKDCNKLDFIQKHYALQQFLLIMACSKQYNLVLFDNNESKEKDDENQACEQYCDSICGCIYNQYQKYFSNQKYISHHLFPEQFSNALPQLQHKKQIHKTFFDTVTPNASIWNDYIHDIIEKCTKMSVKMSNERNISFEEKKVATKTFYRLPVIRSSNNSSTKLYFQKRSTNTKSRHSRKHVKRSITLSNDFLKYNAENKYLFIQIESIENILLELDRIKTFDIQCLYIKLSSNQNCSLLLSNKIKIDYMLCIENAKAAIFQNDCTIQAMQMWLNNTKIVEIEPYCNINTVTSWYYKVNKVINKGQLNHMAHCFVENPRTNVRTVFRNVNEITTHVSFYCNVDTFQNVNGHITTNGIHHVKCNQYYGDNNGKTEVFGVAFYEINKRCNINDEISGTVLVFDCKDEFVLQGKLHAHKHCFIRCDDQIKLESNCNIQCSQTDKQLTLDTFEQNHSKIFGYNYDKFTQLPSNRATPSLWIKSTSLVTNGAIISDGEGKIESNQLLKCIIIFDIAKNCKINQLLLSSNNKVYLLNTQYIEINSSKFNTNRFYVNVIDDIECKLNDSLNCIKKNQINNIVIQSSTINSIDFYVNDINCMQMKRDTNITVLNEVNVKNVHDFQMYDNSQFSIENIEYFVDFKNSSQKCIIETNNLFYMENGSNIYSTFKFLNIKSDGYIQIFGKIWLSECCKFQMKSNYSLVIASSGEILSQSNFVQKAKTKFLQKKTVNKQDLLNHVDDNLKNEYYLHLYCDNITNIYGTIIGKKSLIIIDANTEINIFDDGRIVGGETYIRCMNNISFSGTIDNDCGDCFIVANGGLHLKKNGRICLLFLFYYGEHIIDECYSKTAVNKSLKDVKKKLSKIMDKINNFESYETEKLNKYSKKIKLEDAKKKFKFYDNEVNVTVDKTGLDESNIGKFLKLKNKLLFMTLEQQENLILLDVKLSKFIELIDGEFNHKLSMETYFEYKSLSKLVSILKNQDLDELTTLTCNDENEFENKILPLLTSIKMNLRQERELKKICLKPEIWQKYQNEKEKIITKSISEICPMLSLFFNHLNKAMQQRQTQTLGRLTKNRSITSLAIQTVKESLNVISKFTKRDEVPKHKVILLIAGFLRDTLNNIMNNFVYTILNEIIFNYYYLSTNRNSGILKLTALIFIKGIEECCTEIISNQEQIAESILLFKSILQSKPQTFEKDRKTLKHSENDNEKFEISQKTENKEGTDSCRSLLTNWRLIQYFDEMVKQGWQNTSDWILLTVDDLKYELKFKQGHITRFKRKHTEWYKQKIMKDAIENILITDVNLVQVSMQYFAYFGKFQLSFDKFIQAENILTLRSTCIPNAVFSRKNMNDNHEFALGCLTKDIAEFSQIKNCFSAKITDLQQLAIKCTTYAINTTPSYQTLKIAEINREKYQNIFFKKKQQYDNKLLELNNEYDALIKQKIQLHAQKSTLQYKVSTVSVMNDIEKIIDEEMVNIRAIYTDFNTTNMNSSDPNSKILRCPASTNSSTNSTGKNNQNSNNGSKENNNAHNNADFSESCSQGTGDGNGRRDRNNDDEKKKDDEKKGDNGKNKEAQEEEEEEEDDDDDDDDDENKNVQPSKSILNPRAREFIYHRLPTIYENPQFTQSAPNPKREQHVKNKTKTLILQKTNNNSAKQCRKPNRKKKNKSKSRFLSHQFMYTQKYGECAKYIPSKELLAEGNIQIGRKLTAKIPTLIAEDITYVYRYININTALQYQYEYNDSKIRIFNFDLHSINDHHDLFCVATRVDETQKRNRGFKWRMENRLFTAPNIQSIYEIDCNKLPNSIRSSKEFQIHDKITQIHDKIKCVDFISDTDWKTLPVYCKDPKRRRCRIELKLTVQQFKTKVISKPNKKLVPILMFRNSEICIQYICIVSIINIKCNYDYTSLFPLSISVNHSDVIQIILVYADIRETKPCTDIGVAFEYSQQKKCIEPVGIHLDKNNMISNHQLLFPCPTNVMDELNDFQCNYEDLHIGDVDAPENNIKHKQQTNEKCKENILCLKKENKQLKQENIQLKTENKKIKETCKNLIQEKDNEINDLKQELMRLRDMLRLNQTNNTYVSSSSLLYAVDSLTSTSSETSN